MVCANCGLLKTQHENQKDGGAGSGKPKHEFRHERKGNCNGYEKRKQWYD